MNQFKIQELRKLDENKLKEILEQISKEIMIYRSASSGYIPTNMPKGKSASTVDWGRVKQLKKARARINTILSQRKFND